MGQHRAPERSASRRSRRVAGFLGLVLLAAASVFTAGPAAAQSPGVGQVRLGHLSPSTPAVDVYLTADGAPAAREPLLRGAVYGVITPYQDLAPGRYTVDMRTAGSSPDTEPPLSAAVQVTPQSAQSLLFFDTGEGGTVQGHLLTDDRTPAAAGSGRVRVVQGAASAGPVEMQALGGPRLATALAYGTVTDYATVDARSWKVAISARGQRLQTALEVADGSVSTVVLTSAPAGALGAEPLVDVPGAAAGVLPGAPRPPSGPPATAVPDRNPAAAKQATPSGAVPAGAGGTADLADPLPVLLGLAGGLLLVFAITRDPVGRLRRRA